MADLARIERWIQENRPDVIPYWQTLRENNGVILLVTIGYEAGFEAGEASREVRG